MMATNTTPLANNGRHRPQRDAPTGYAKAGIMLFAPCWPIIVGGRAGLVNFAGTVAGGKMDKSRDAIVTA
jgi:hypothetical protein